jgi:YVTN family beta-propeller protein
MEFRILGPLEVRDGSRRLVLGGERQRAVLAILLLYRNEVVSAERLIDELWGETPPAAARQTLRAYVSKLRRAMATNGAAPAVGGDSEREPCDGVLLTRGHGYVLKVLPGELDLDRFVDAAERGRDALATGRPEDAARVLREALALWRGVPLAEFSYEGFAQSAIAHCEELHLGAVEERVEADLVLGQARELVGELRDLVTRHPLRERLRGQLMLALYRAGRQAEALEVYQHFRKTLSEELGLEPGPGLQQLELAILHRDPALDLPVTGAAPVASRPGRPGASAAPSRRHRAPMALAVGALLVALALVGAVMASSRGRARAVLIAGDGVGAISPSGGAIRTVVPLGSSPSGVASGDGAVWVASPSQDTVSRIDPASRAVVQTIQVGSSPTGVAVGAAAVWVTNYYGQTVSRIDPSVDRVVQTIPVGNGPTGVAVGDGSVWVANASDGTVSRINAVSGAVSDTVGLGGAGATDVAVGAGGVWVSDEAGDRVVRIDPDADQVTATINVGSGPTAIAIAFGSVWVTNSLDGTVSRIDPATSAVQATIEVGDGAGAIAIGEGAVWVADQYAGTVARIQPVTDSVARTIGVGSLPQGLALADGLVWVGARAAATSHRGGTVTGLGSGVVDTLDPVFTADLGAALSLTNDGLTAYQHVGGSGSVQLVPDLAVSLPSPTDGGTTYTFQLRRGIRYSDNELVRPEDFRRALERDLILGPNSNYGDVFADVVGGAACAAHPSRCDVSRGVVTDDAANTVTFHLVAPDPDFLARLTLPDAFAVPAGTPMRNIDYHPLPATGPYKWVFVSRDKATLERNPYFHEWSHAAQPDGYPDQIVLRHAASQADELTAIEQGRADFGVDGVPAGSVNQLELRFANRLYIEPTDGANWLILNTRVTPFNDLRVRQALSYAIDRGKITRLLQTGGQPTCQMLTPFILGYRPYCPYTLDPNPSGRWVAPNLAEARRLIAATHTRGTPITIWNLGGYDTDYTSIEPYLTSLLDRLGYPTKVKDLHDDFPQAPARFADSRTQAQAALGASYPAYPSAAAIVQADFACQSFLPDSPGNANTAEFCDPQLDAQINNALAAQNNNSPHAAALWAQADQTATDQAPAIPLNIPSNVYLVSARIGNYQYSLTAGFGVLPDQLWVR